MNYLRVLIATAFVISLSGCKAAPERVATAAPRSDITLCKEIRESERPKSHLAFYGPSSYRDGLVVPTMITSMSSDDVIAAIKKVCAKPLNVDQLYINLFREAPIRVGDDFYREQEYSLQSPEFYSIHGGCSAAIYVWFNPDGSIHGIYNGYQLCAI